MKNINSKTTSDANSISNRCIKELPDEALSILQIIFNKSLDESYLPPIWKSAHIIMLPKKGDPNDINNFRPISITPVLMRLFEKVILFRIQDFNETNNIIVKEQSGFRRKRGTKDNLIFLSQKTTQAFNSNKKMCVIYFDIQSAFDKVWHIGLIIKLLKLSFPPYIIFWLKYFLENRKYCIKVDETISEWFNSNVGCPQGSVLSPTLFSLFINDIPQNIEGNS